jgi:peptidoglycan/xylan/chitin deacetylase (PgdA/CDA1 family)
MSIFNCIPVMMYHHVNGQEETSVSITPEHFEEQIKYLSGAGYRSLFLDEFFKVLDRWNIPEKLVVITFDDGYADNYRYAYPILKKYNMKATIFPVTAFIKTAAQKDREIPDNSDILMDSITAKTGLDGYLTWEEMKEMQKSGLIDIQAHCHTHAAYFEDNKILSFYDDSDNPKIGWATDGDMRRGIPLYRTGPALAVRRYFDDVELRNRLADHAYSHGVIEKELYDIVRLHGGPKGRFETETESNTRIMTELALTKDLIEAHMNKKVDYICWPWGSVDWKLMDRARRAGYTGGIGMKGGANMRLTNRMDIHRFNPCRKDIPALKMKLFKHSNLFYSSYIDKRIDDMLIKRERFL